MWKSLARMRLFTYSSWMILLVLSTRSDPARGVDREAFESLDLPIAGTPKRLEYEFKFAFVLPEGQKGFTLKAFKDQFSRILMDLITKRKLQFDRLSFSKYHLDPSFQTFVFEDTYLDTKDFLLKEHNSAYRLRYRWSFAEKYYRYQLLPFLSPFYPDRLEIQFKTGYRRNSAQKTIEVYETRFEFRDESPPFHQNLKAPPPPWPKKDYLPVALSGIFPPYRLEPMAELLKSLPQSLKEIPLQPVLLVTSERWRTHLNLKHPFGSGPNPDQVFILTMDVSKVTDLDTQITLPTQFLELEVEIDRNTTTNLEKLLALESPDRPMAYIQSFSKKSLSALHHDLALIRDEAVKLLQQGFQLEDEKVNNKYSRFVTQLIQHR